MRYMNIYIDYSYNYSIMAQENHPYPCHINMDGKETLRGCLRQVSA